MNKKKTIPQLQAQLKSLQSKAPRAGVLPSKVIPDKSKYSRKKKHKDDFQD